MTTKDIPVVDRALSDAEAASKDSACNDGGRFAIMPLISEGGIRQRQKEKRRVFGKAVLSWARNSSRKVEKHGNRKNTPQT